MPGGPPSVLPVAQDRVDAVLKTTEERLHKAFVGAQNALDKAVQQAARAGLAIKPQDRLRLLALSLLFIPRDRSCDDVDERSSYGSQTLPAAIVAPVDP